VKLSELRIKSLGIIEELVWQPEDGLNIITGETGAGKSLIVEALDILFFSRADELVIRHGANQASIEAYFSLESPVPASLQAILEEKEIEIDSDGLLIETQIRKQGRSTYRVNATPVPKSIVSQFGCISIDMHTQAQHLTLFNQANHLDILDDFGHIGEYKKLFGEMLSRLNKLHADRKTVERDALETERRRDFITYQINELNRADLKAGEDLSLEAELQTLASAEKIKELGQRLHIVITGGVDNESVSALDCCGQGLELSTQLSYLDSHFSSIAEQLEQINANLEDLGHEISRYNDNIDTSGARLEEVENRLDTLKNLKKKYNKNIEQLIEFRDEAAGELEKLESIPVNLKKLDTEIESVKLKMAALAVKMHDARKAAARQLEKSVNKELSELGMSGVAFAILIENEEDEQNGLPVSENMKLAYNKNGTDIITFTASTNPGEPQKPLQNIASTGEASRFTLAVKNSLAQTDSVPIMIFDEIDIGVGGRSGEVIGKKLWSLSRHHQIICITHLPQIAVFADQHFRVTKVAGEERNTSQIDLLDEREHLQELAEMLSSKEYSDQAMEAADDLCRKAAMWKKSQAQD